MNAERELLRRAADLIEETASDATKVRICPEWTRQAVRHIARNCEIECYHEVAVEEHPVDGEMVDADGVTHDGWDRYGDAPWFALMGAYLAAPLVSWLRTVAELDAGFSSESTGEAVKFARALIGVKP